MSNCHLFKVQSKNKSNTESKHMNIKKIYTAPITGYQYISKMFPGNCRYYPTCSEYAKWQFEFNSAHRAIWASSLRILRCNQLFDGGIDYPVINYTPPKYISLLRPKAFYGKIKIIYWLVPKGSDPHPKQYFVLKDFDANKTQQPT